MASNATEGVKEGSREALVCPGHPRQRRRILYGTMSHIDAAAAGMGIPLYVRRLIISYLSERLCPDPIRWNSNGKEHDVRRPTGFGPWTDCRTSLR